jgi:hypothetical protein
MIFLGHLAHNMAQEQVNAILEALKTGFAIRTEREREAREQANQQSEAQYRKDEADRYKQQLALEEKRIDAENQSAAINRQLLLQKLTDAYVSTGSPIPGDKTSPGLHPGTMVHNIPVGNTTMAMELPTPEQHATDVANLARIQDAPAEESRIREQKAQQEAETERMLSQEATQHTNRLAELAQENTYRLNQIKQTQDAETARSNTEIASRLHVAMINATGGLFGMDTPGSSNVRLTTNSDGSVSTNSVQPNEIVKNALDDMKNFRLSREEFEKKYGKSARYLESMGQSQGLGLLNKDQKSQVQDLEAVAQVIPVLHEMNLIRAQYPIKDLIPGTDAYKLFTTDEDKVGKAQPAIARILSGTKRFNATEIEKYQDALIPRRNLLKSDYTSGFQKYNDFVSKDVQDAFNTITSGLPKPAQDMLRDQLGYTKFPYLGSALKTPGMNPGTPQGAVPATFGQPGQPGQ